MLTKNDCMSILVKLEDAGLNINPYMRQLAISRDIPTEVLKFIAQNQGLEAVNFYEMLRKKHNQKKSQLYVNILKEKTEEADVITTLSCLLTQIVLYANKLPEGKASFLKEARAAEISQVLNGYFLSGDYSGCLDLLKLVKTDLLVLEYLNGRRDLQA